MPTGYNVVVMLFALVGLILGIVAITKTSKNAKAIAANLSQINRNIKNHNALDESYEQEKDKLKKEIATNEKNIGACGGWSNNCSSIIPIKN